MKKVLSLILTLSLLISMALVTPAQAADSNKFVVFTTNWIVKDNARIDEYKTIIKEKFGKDLVIINPPFAEAAEKLNIMLASGEQIDVIWKSTPGDMLMLVEKDLLYPLEDMLKASATLTQDQWSGWNYLDPVSYDGHVYALPLMKASAYIPTINKAWLDKLGLPIPTTFAELESTLRAFKDAKLAGDATIPLAHQWSYCDHVASFLGMFGLPGPNVYLEDGKRVHPWLTAEAAQGLTWLQSMYKDGILDSEFPTAQEEPMRQKVISGMVGLFFDWAGANNDMNAKAKEQGNLCEMVAMPAPAAIDGKPAYITGNTICMWMVPKTAADPQASFDLISYWYSKEGAEKFSLTEGYDYKVVDGKKIGDPVNGNFIVDVSKTGTLVKALERIGLDATQESIDGAAVMDAQIIFPSPLPGIGDVQDIARPLVLRCITGELTVQAFQDELRTELLAKGLID